MSQRTGVAELLRLVSMLLTYVPKIDNPTAQPGNEPPADMNS